MLLRRVLYLILLVFGLRVLTSCGLFGGDPEDVYFHWSQLHVFNVSFASGVPQDTPYDTMPRNAISFRVRIDGDCYGQQVASLYSLFQLSELNAFSVATREIPYHDIDSFTVLTMFDLSNEFAAQSNVTSLFLSEESAWNYELYKPLEEVRGDGFFIHFTPRIQDLDSVQFIINAHLSNNSILSDTTNVITVIDPS